MTPELKKKIIKEVEDHIEILHVIIEDLENGRDDEASGAFYDASKCNEEVLHLFNEADLA